MSSVRYVEKSGTVNVSILGSCRQTSICKYFPTTNLHEELTYPHYTKEIIQAIEYASGVKKINDIDTLYCFRKGILHRSPIQYEKVRELFNQTDIFLVEIASRKKYMYNGNYVHHILTEEKYGFPNRNDIEITNQTDEEIEEDLIRIRELLYPKPFIVISHLHTRTTGIRYQLISLLDKVCKDLDIPFMNPSYLLRNYNPTDLYEQENVLMHYTETGHHHIGMLYKEWIEKTIYQLSLPTIIQMYYTDQERVKTQTFHGLGDYIRGCGYLYNYCKQKNITFQVSFSHHLLSNFLYTTRHTSKIENINTRYFFGDNIFHEHIDTLSYPKYIFTNNLFDFSNLSVTEKNHIIHMCLTPRISFQQKIHHRKLELGIEDTKYSVIHIRLGDSGLVNHSANEDFIFNTYKKILEHLDSQDTWIIITDNLYLEKMFQSNGHRVSNSRKTHLGHHTQTLQDVEDTLLDFFLMTTSHTIHQCSIYSWGSGFSGIVHSLYNIPLIQHRL